MSMKAGSYVCTSCGKVFSDVRGGRKSFLCKDCRTNLIRICIVCGKEIRNIENEIPGKFLKRKVCSEECRREDAHRRSTISNPMKNPEIVARAHVTRRDRFEKGLWTPHILTQQEKDSNRLRMLRNNPMKDPEIAKRNGDAHRILHQQSPVLWKEKYRAAKFSHWVKVAEGLESVGPQRSGANIEAVAFFSRMREYFGWITDTDFFESHPYEFPLIISLTNKICYFPDYYNKSKNLIIEWDEIAHTTPCHRTKDKRRDSQINNKYPEIRIIRLLETAFGIDQERLDYIEQELSK